MSILRTDFLESIFMLNKLPEFYKFSESDFTNTLTYKNSDKIFPNLNNEVAIVKDIPSYIDLDSKSLPQNIKKLNIKYYKGFAINFDGVDNLQSYLKSQFGNSSRYKLRRSIKKLESAFDISYKMYFGEISKTEYEFVFNEFFRLLEIRSKEKGILENRNIKRKDYYYKIVFPLILKKKASLFVIYNNEKPIDICLNFHSGEVIFQFIRTYDIAYSKFNTGYIDLMKQIEWCLENKINIISFGYGAFYWKKRWCNYNYNYYYNIFYNKKSLKAIINTSIQLSNLKIRHNLRKRGFIDKFHHLKNKISNVIKPNNESKIIISPIDYSKNVHTGNSVNINDSEYIFLRKPTYDFLFNSKENEKNINVFKIENDNNTYLIKGEKSKALVNIN